MTLYTSMQPPTFQPIPEGVDFDSRTLQQVQNALGWIFSNPKMVGCLIGIGLSILVLAALNATAGLVGTLKSSLASGKLVLAISWIIKEFDDHQPAFIMVALSLCFVACCWGWYYFSKNQRTVSDIFAFFGTMTAAPLGSRALDTFLEERRRRKAPIPDPEDLRAIKEVLETIRRKIDSI